jgi:hypothetical protein
MPSRGDRDVRFDDDVTVVEEETKTPERTTRT